MNEIDFETQIGSLASWMDYPPTPDIAGRLRPRLRPSPSRPRFISKAVAWSLTLLLVLCSSLFLIPPARAAILEFIQIGIVRILKPETAPPPAPIEADPFTRVSVTVTPAPTAQPLIPLLTRLLGETTLADAAGRVNFPVQIPAYPSGLGQPDHVFVQEANGEMVFLVWLDPQAPSEVLMCLNIIPAGSWAITKMAPVMIQETEVNGLSAAWAVGPYPLRLSNGDIEYTRLVDGHVLIWADGDVTYRLETDLPLEEALKVAESLQPMP